MSLENSDTILPMLSLLLLVMAETPAILVQAESFLHQEKTERRKWVVREDDEAKKKDAVGSWIQVLPDTRKSHDDKLIAGENFSNVPGQMAVVHYEVNVPSAGRYYVWVRAFSQGPEDNGIHVGIDGKWPASGERMQWCEGKNTWRWQSSQRTAAQHCGEPGKIYLDVSSPGRHLVSFSMREDGFAMDSFLLTKDPAYKP